MATAANTVQSAAPARQLPPQNCTSFSIYSIYLLKEELNICLEGESTHSLSDSQQFQSFWHQNIQFYCSHVTGFDVLL